MLDILFKILAFIVAISILVAVHEYGHFWVARKLGFKVLRFSIGFGKPLLRWKGRDGDGIEYWISMLPLGGYVKLLDEREGPVDEADRDRAFNQRPIPHRIAVLAAGPAFNFIFAVIAYWAMFMAGVTGLKPVVGSVADQSVAAESGLLAGDTLLAVGGREVDTWESATLVMLDQILAREIIELRVQSAPQAQPRNVTLDVTGRAHELTREGVLFTGLGIDLVPPRPAQIGSVVAGEPAEAAGLLPGDRIVSVDGEPVTYWRDLQALIGPRAGGNVLVGISRDGSAQSVRVDVASQTDEVTGEAIGRIGIGAQALPPDLIDELLTEQRFGPLASVSLGVAKTWEMSALTVRMLARMVTGDVSVRNVSGPITIADFAGDSAQAGLGTFLNFLAVVSISLGILNLLPIPLLDGGQIVYQLAEAIKGRPLSERAMMFGQQVGLLFFVVLTGFVVFNDLARVFG